MKKDKLNEDEEMVTITKKEYDELLKDSEILYKLHRGGVDNWEWYYESLKDEDDE